MFDFGREPSVPILAASVILLRERGGNLEVFLLRRNRRASFMSDAFVFPGGRVEPDDGSLQAAAIRELFEEAGVLLVCQSVQAARAANWRQKLLSGAASFGEMCTAEGWTVDEEKLCEWAHWRTPSVEPKRFDAHFFVAELPDGQEPSFDQQETVEEKWVAINEALARHEQGEIRLPPPQVKTIGEIATVGGELESVLSAAAVRAQYITPILPRLADPERQMPLTLLLPWDPEYVSLGVGESLPLSPSHPLADKPNRFVLEGTVWLPR